MLARMGVTAGTGIATPQDVLDAVGRLAPAIAARADETEAARRVPRDLLDGLAAAGVFRLLRPASHGGLGAPLPDGLLVFEALARTDASVGWNATMGAGSFIDIAGLPRASFDALFATAPDAVTAGVFSPSGTLEADGDGGFRVDGRWSFASGCEDADWIYANCIEGFDDGVPRMRMAVFTPDQVTIEDTWRVVGLCGTGSHHIRVEGARVPVERTTRPMVDPPCVDAPSLRVPPPAYFALGVAGVALGVARGALDDVLALATDKVPLLQHRPLAENATFHMMLATADTELAAARALWRETAEAVWATAEAGDEPTLTERARTRAAAAWSAHRAADVVRSAYRAAGGGAIHLGSPFQRRLRDIDAITQHMLVRPDTLTTAGRILAGQEPDVPVF
jgi:alkylation response protein AidB-like acyl-CoA dehydrogenase